MTAPWGNRGMTPLTLKLHNRWRSVLNFTPRTIFPKGGKHNTHWIGSWVGPRADQDTLENRWIEPRFLGYLALSPVTPPTTKDLLNPVAGNTVLCCPWDIRNEKTSFNPFPWQSRDRTPKQFWKLLSNSVTETYVTSLFLWKYSAKTATPGSKFWTEFCVSFSSYYLYNLIACDV
jgi:hypothetical protein